MIRLIEFIAALWRPLALLLHDSGPTHVVVDSNPTDWPAVVATLAAAALGAWVAVAGVMHATRKSREALERQLSAEAVLRSDDRVIAALADWHEAMLAQAVAVEQQLGLEAVRSHRLDVQTALLRMRLELQRTDESFVMSFAGVSNALQQRCEALAGMAAATAEQLRKPRQVVEHVALSLTWSVIGAPRGEWSKKSPLGNVQSELQKSI